MYRRSTWMSYDEQVKAAEEAGLRDAGNLHPEFAPEVQWDSDLRLGNLESIGVVAEVLFANGQPFQMNRLDDFASSASVELGEVGRQVYNRWLVDFCARAPERRRGQLAISFDDVDQAVKEVYWAKENGLGGIRLPGLTRSGRFFFDPDLDPVWAACEETGLTVSQHGGAADPNEPSGGGGARAHRAGVRRVHDDLDRERVLLQPLALDADRRRRVRPIPGAARGLDRNPSASHHPDDQLPGQGLRQ